MHVQHGTIGRWKGFAASPYAIAAAATLGMLLSLPSLHVGFMIDDYIHWDILTGHFHNAHAGSPFGLFSFANGDPARTHELMEKGIFPWWTTDRLRVAFWRPLSEWTHWLDYRLWPDSPGLMHAQNIAWYGALVLALGAWFRAIDPNRARAAMATLIYAISPQHGTVIGWIANRNALVAAFFSLLTLIGFHRACGGRAHSWRHALVAYTASCATFALALLSGEAAVATLAYLFAYALLLDAGPRRLARATALVPYACIVLVWHVLYLHLGYGARASGMYIDPVGDYSRFIPAVALRLPVLLLAQLFGVAATRLDFPATLSRQLVYWGSAVAAIGMFAFALRAAQVHLDRLAQFHAVGMVLALIPVCATLPDDRLLTLAGFGGAGLLAVFFFAVASRFGELRGARGIAVKSIAGYLVVVCFVASVVLLPRRVGSMARTVDPVMTDPSLTLPQKNLTMNTRVVLINPPLMWSASYLPFVRAEHGLVNPRSAIPLAPGIRPSYLTVIDGNTLEMSVPAGFIVPIDSLFRDPRLAFKPGDRVDLGYLHIDVVQVTPDGQPETVRFRFARPLSDPDLQFYIWDRFGYREFPLPERGRRIRLGLPA
jgi:hypothetical protein